MASPTLIVTHPGGAHKDDLLACAVLAAEHRVPIARREPTPEDLDDPAVWVVDVGGRHEPKLGNFDHHQFPRDARPLCSLSLVLDSLGLYQDALSFCDWLETAEWLDCRGPKHTAEWLGVERDILSRLNSPLDITLLRRFAAAALHQPGEPLYEVLSFTGSDLLDYLRSLRQRLTFLSHHAEFWSLDVGVETREVVFLPRTQPLPEDPSQGLPRFIHEQKKAASVIAMVYPDRRGSGYGLSRFEDHPALDFRRIADLKDVHFAHASGFVAKTSATDPTRLRQLLEIARAT